MLGGTILTARDQLKLDLITKVEMGVLDREIAALTLDVTERTIRRYIKRYREEGVLFMLHKNKGKTPPNKTNEPLKIEVQTLIRETYYDFNMLHALEKINQDLDCNIKREVFRRWSHEIGLVKRKRKRRSRPRKYRGRMKQTGILVQMDGSHHKWFGGIESCLIALIDDATSEVIQAEFAYGETTDACMKVLKEAVEKKGAFKILYVDKAGVFGGVKRTGFSQVERALGRLGTSVIYADSPQAKGRIERLFDTLQDRLIPEMRIAGIKSMREANKFLKNIYIPQQHNPKFACLPDSPISAYSAIPSHLDLEQVFCRIEVRKVGKDHTLSFEGRRYMLDANFEYSIAGQRIEIRMYRDGAWSAYYGEKKMKLIKIEKITRLAG